ncbi:MAG: FGGY-family carbohydrate kinase, partial [Bacilli bacterium]|nr:FGGY-family carbohydrate kinase [Bacilli bacterium]
MKKYVLAYDTGTTGVKTCIFAIDKKIELIAGASRSYPLYTFANGGAEQDPDDWWEGMRHTTKEVLTKAKIKPEEIAGISFCSQAQGLVLVDKHGHHVRRAMSYMDQRASEEVKKGMSYGLQVAGANIFKLIPSLRITGAVSSSVKDPLWKYKWVEAHEPHVFAKIHKWLDVKDYLILRCTDQFTMTIDDAYSTFLFDNRPKKMRWSKKLCKMFGVNMEHLPKVIKSTDCAGLLTKTAAKELGLVPGIKVFGGCSDASLIGVGAGATAVGDTHIYCGTSGWVNTVIDHRLVDTKAMIAGISGADDQTLNYFAEMETAGKCLDWAKNHLARDEIILYLHAHREYKTYEEKQIALYKFLNEKVKSVPPGANGVLFTPWLHGNRCPFEDPNAAGMFFGMTLETGKTELIRALLEGVYYHIRWMLECHEKKLKI